MRVALLYSGLPRMWRQCHATQMRLFPNAQIDVFFHFWDTIQQDERQEILDTMRPADFMFEPPRDYSFIHDYPEIRPDNINVPSRMVSQYMSWRKVATLFQPHAPRYDIAVRSRSDLYFFDTIRVDLTQVADGDIALLTYLWPENPRQVGDMFAVGTPPAIVEFLSLMDRIWQYAGKVQFNCEALITEHLLALLKSKDGMAMLSLPDLPFFVCRPHMIGWTAERCLAEGPGISKWRDRENIEAHAHYHATQRGDEGRAAVDRFIQSRLAGTPFARVADQPVRPGPDPVSPAPHRDVMVSPILSNPASGDPTDSARNPDRDRTCPAPPSLSPFSSL